MSGDRVRRLASRLAPGYARPGDVENPLEGLSGAIVRYRVMAYVVGVGLLVLVVLGVPLQYGATVPQIDNVVGPIHGFLYIVYLLTAVDLARRARFTLPQMVAMIAAGFLPLMAFIIEHRVVVRLRAMLDVGTAGETLGEGPGLTAPGTAEA
ncbi:MAG: DUF3817 domain-containing protein [Acidimicrobiales bacterium]